MTPECNANFLWPHLIQMFLWLRRLVHGSTEWISGACLTPRIMDNTYQNFTILSRRSLECTYFWILSWYCPELYPSENKGIIAGYFSVFYVWYIELWIPMCEQHACYITLTIASIGEFSGKYICIVVEVC